MRLINADKLNAVLQNMAGHLAETGDALLAACLIYCQEVVDQQRTVEVVRCRDCMKRKTCEHTRALGINGFCSDGERRPEK